MNFGFKQSVNDLSGHKDGFRHYQRASLNFNLVLLFCYKERLYYAVLKHQKEDSMSEHLLIGYYILRDD